MMSRLDSVFADMAERRRGGLITYATAGDPDRAASADILIALAKCGADVLEVGVPFSDPLADGPVIQRASERALAGGTTLRGALEVVRTSAPPSQRPSCSSRMPILSSEWTRWCLRGRRATPAWTAC